MKTVLYQYCKSGSTSQACHCHQLLQPTLKLLVFVPALLTHHSSAAVLEHSLKISFIDFTVKTFDCVLEQPWLVIAR